MLHLRWLYLFGLPMMGLALKGHATSHVTGQVLRLKGREVTANRGSHHGIFVGQQASFYSQQDRSKKRTMARGIVSVVGVQVSIVRLHQGQGTVREGDLVAFAPPSPRTQPSRLRKTKQKGAKPRFGTLTRIEILRAIRKHLPQVKQCYEQELQHPDNLGLGLVRIRWIIGTTGKVLQAQITVNRNRKKQLAQCLRRVVLRMRFPRPKGGGIVIVTYPFRIRINPL